MNDDSLKEAKDRIIFALDVPHLPEAVRCVKMLEGLVGCFKVGLELFVREGPRVLQAIEDNSTAEIFLDLKLHDIPVTVRGALSSALNYRVRFITVHCDQSKLLLDAPLGNLSGGLEILAVTVLTSLGEDDLPRLGFREGLTLQQLALKRAELAKQAGCAGVICSGQEAAAIKDLCGRDFKVVVPGIRPDWCRVANDDQVRVTTPQAAIAAGADMIVVGRPIRTAPDPQDAAKKIAEEIQSALALNPGS